jgi:hypothetical protein
MKKILIFFLTFLGISQAAISQNQNNKLEQIAQIDEDTPLILEHAKDYKEQNEKIELAYHYSHRSHYSHSSHRSHYSHYSSY